MNWSDIKGTTATQNILTHYQKLGKFRANHPSIGAGIHQMVSSSPYWFTRTYNDDKVLIGLDLDSGIKEISVSGIFQEGLQLRDAYSGKVIKVKNGKAIINTEYTVVLFEKI